MREGLFEVRLFLRADNTPLEERVVKGTNYFVAVPGEEYYMKVFVYRNSEGKFPLQYIRIAAYVDGIDVNYWKRLDMSNEHVLPTDINEPLSATFWGFKKSDSEIQSFRFANMRADGPGLGNATGNRIGSSNSSSSSSSETNIRESTGTGNTTTMDATSGSIHGLKDAGHIKIDIFEAEVSEGMISNLSGCHEVPTQAGAHSASQKFWSQPSVTTVGGKKLSNVEKFTPIERWSNKPHPVTGSPDTPLYTLEGKYHTSLLISTLEEIFEESAETGGSASTETGSDLGKRRGSNRAPKSLGFFDLTNDSDDDSTNVRQSANVTNSISGLTASISTGSLPEGGRGYVSVYKQVRLVDMSGAPSDESEDEDQGGISAQGGLESFSVTGGHKRLRRSMGVDTVIQERVETYMEEIICSDDEE